MKYYYMKYYDRILNKTTKGYAPQSLYENVFNEIAPDGYLRYSVKSLIGDFTIEQVRDMNKQRYVKIIA